MNTANSQRAAPEDRSAGINPTGNDALLSSGHLEPHTDALGTDLRNAASPIKESIRFFSLEKLASLHD
jgi:hypothetical protein